MELKDQVVSLELAKRLKELGVKQYSYSQWYVSDRSDYSFLVPPNLFLDSKDTYTNKYSAFTVAELATLLPHRVTTIDREPYNSFRLRIEKILIVPTLWPVENYSINYVCDTTSQEMDWLFCALTKPTLDESFANALAKMLIYLIENGLIKKEDHAEQNKIN